MKERFHQEIIKETELHGDEINEIGTDACNESSSGLKINVNNKITSTQVDTVLEYTNLSPESHTSTIYVDDPEDNFNDDDLIAPNNTNEECQVFGVNNTITHNSLDVQSKSQGIQHSNLSTMLGAGISTNFLICHLLASSSPKSTCEVTADNQSLPVATLEPDKRILSASELSQVEPQKFPRQLGRNFSPFELEKMDCEFLERGNMPFTGASCVKDENAAEDHQPNEDLVQQNQTVLKSMRNSV